jgi:hypothetical protein
MYITDIVAEAMNAEQTTQETQEMQETQETQEETGPEQHESCFGTVNGDDILLAVAYGHLPLSESPLASLSRELMELIARFVREKQDAYLGSKGRMTPPQSPRVEPKCPNAPARIQRKRVGTSLPQQPLV